MRLVSSKAVIHRVLREGNDRMRLLRRNTRGLRARPTRHKHPLAFCGMLPYPGIQNGIGDSNSDANATGHIRS